MVIKTFEPSKHLQMIPLSATVSRKCVGVGGWGGTVVTNAFHSYNAKKNLKKGMPHYLSVSLIDASNGRQCSS